MVSNAKEDFPDPESPVKTTNFSRGIYKSMFFKLCSLAPLTLITSLIRLLAPHQNLSGVVCNQIMKLQVFGAGVLPCPADTNKLSHFGLGIIQKFIVLF